MNINEVKKENLHQLAFPTKDVLINHKEREQRSYLLTQALKLSNMNKHKSKIIFRDYFGVSFVYTTIWFVSDKHIELKAGISLPIQAILDIIL